MKNDKCQTDIGDVLHRRERGRLHLARSVVEHHSTYPSWRPTEGAASLSACGALSKILVTCHRHPVVPQTSSRTRQASHRTAKHRAVSRPRPTRGKGLRQRSTQIVVESIGTGVPGQHAPHPRFSIPVPSQPSGRPSGRMHIGGFLNVPKFGETSRTNSKGTIVVPIVPTLRRTG